MTKIKYKFLVLFRGQTSFKEYEVEIDVSKGQCVTDAWLKVIRMSAVDGDYTAIHILGLDEVDDECNSRK